MSTVSARLRYALLVAVAVLVTSSAYNAYRAGALTSGAVGSAAISAVIAALVYLGVMAIARSRRNR